jgi:hypothetical protein
VKAGDTIPQKDTVKKHSWVKATVFSAVIPGAGQIYNSIAMPKRKKHAYWKVPLIYAGLGVSTYFAVKNSMQMKAYRNEYESRLAGNDPINFTEYDSQGLLTFYTQDRTKRDFAILGMGLVYILNIIDAGVEAHFVNFDISDNLTLSIRPKMYNNLAYGASLQLNFR